MSTLYKGAGPGTHWHANDPRLGGFSVSANRPPTTVDAVISHIVIASHPSPYLSFTASFAVACSYASAGPGGPASAANPGYIYEIDTELAPPGIFLDPIHFVSAPPSGGTIGHSTHHHDGGQDLILAIAAPAIHRAILYAAPRRPPQVLPTAPMVSRTLQCLTFALRDAEVLATSGVPSQAIVRRHEVY